MCVDVGSTDGVLVLAVMLLCGGVLRIWDGPRDEVVLARILFLQ